MSTKRYWAKVQNEKVLQVLKADKDFIDSYIDGVPGKWIETKKDGSIRKNFANQGFSYSSADDAFAEPQPYPSWKLNKDTYKWEPPVDYPWSTGKPYSWDEENKAWEEVT